MYAVIAGLCWGVWRALLLSYEKTNKEIVIN